MVQNNPLYQIREYTPSDYGMVSDWWDAHGRPPCPEGMLPKLGIIVTEHAGDGQARPVAAMWLYLDNSVGVCFLERAVTCSGLGMKAARTALFCGIDFLKKAAARMDYGVMLLRTYPAMARFARQVGFYEDDKATVCLMTLTRGEDSHG
ncbi:MAG: hypothetical protein WCQ16_02815 [Verrucomicrobiae bacterium]